MPDEETRFWSKAARNYDRVVDLQIGPETRSIVRQRIIQETRLGNVAEFGCGTGFYTEALADKADSLIATDLSAGMLALAQERVKARHVTFQMEDCQETSFPSDAFDTAFMSLLIHFTEPAKTLTEMRRILKPGGLLIIANLDVDELRGWDLIRCRIRVIYRGLIGYRMKPPKGFGNNVLSLQELSALLAKTGFKVVSSEAMKDASHSSHIPVDYVKAVKV